MPVLQRISIRIYNCKSVSPLTNCFSFYNTLILYQCMSSFQGILGSDVTSFLVFSMIVMFSVVLLESMYIFVLIGRKMTITDHDLVWFIRFFDMEYVESLNNLNVHMPSVTANPLVLQHTAFSMTNDSGSAQVASTSDTMGVELTSMGIPMVQGNKEHQQL